MKSAGDYNEYDLPDPGEVPPEEGMSPGMIVLTVVNVALAVSVVGISVMPVVWYELIASFETNVAQYDPNRFLDRKSATPEPVQPSAELLAYQKLKWAYRTLAIASLIPAIMLFRVAYGTFLDELQVISASLWVGSAGVLFAANWILGWGGAWSLGLLLVAVVEIALLQVPAVRDYLAQTPKEEE